MHKKCDERMKNERTTGVLSTSTSITQANIVTGTDQQKSAKKMSGDGVSRIQTLHTMNHSLDKIESCFHQILCMFFLVRLTEFQLKCGEMQISVHHTEHSRNNNTSAFVLS